jgi:hypothetical protein
MINFNKVGKRHAEDFGNETANRFMRPLAFIGAVASYTKYSEIVYEGDNLSVFGTFKYNTLADRWEIETPLAFIRGSKDDYLNHLFWEKLWTISGILGRGLLLGGCAFGLSWASYKLLGRFHRYLKRKIRERF